MRRFSKQLGGGGAGGQAGAGAGATGTTRDPVPAIVVDDSDSNNNDSLSKQSSNSNTNTNNNENNNSSNLNNKRKRLVQYGRRAVRFPISLSPSPPPPPPSSTSTSSSTLPPPPPAAAAAAAVTNPQRPISISSSSSLSTSSLLPRPSSSTSSSSIKERSNVPAANKPHNNTNNNNTMSWFPSSENIEYNQKPPKLPPKKPTSQMAASRPEEPDEEKIATFLAFSGESSREVAIRYLKAKHNDIQAAAGAYLDGEDISKDEATSTWDESAFSTDREGVRDQFLHPLGAPPSATATRPNSPAPSMNNSSNRQNMQPSTRAQEDEDFAKAMQMSQADSLGGGGGVAAAGQEMGMIAADGSESRMIGPVTQREYDERSNWQMVPHNQQQQQLQTGRNSSDEVIPDLDAPDRVNQPGQPRLLKHLPDGDYLSAFLTICHSIEGVREALLMRDHLQTSYGEDAEWWRGHPISMPTIVHMDDGSTAEPDRSSHDDLTAEVQRLMAFLSSSERSYASVGALTQTQAIRDSSPVTTQSKTLLELFIRCWISAASSSVKTDESDTSRLLRNLFTTTVGTNSPDGMDTPDMNVVDLPVRIPEGSTSDLMERLDDLLWDTDADGEVTTDNFIERPADVVVVRMFQQSSADKQLRVEVPASFHIDKYLPQNLEATRGTRRRMALAKKRIATIEEIETRLTIWKHPKKDKQLDAKQLLSHTLGHFTGANRTRVLSADKSFSASAEGEDDFQPPPHYADISQRLQSIIASIDKKLTVLASEKEKTRKALLELSRSPGSGLPESELKYRYTLRGVATKPNITYLLAPIDPSAASNNDENNNAGNSDSNNQMTSPADDDDSPPGMQWWRLEYEVPSTGTSAKITKTPAADYDVLRAVELEHNTALLVYASDRIQTAGAAGADDDDSAMVVDPLIASTKPPPATTTSSSMDANTTSTSQPTTTTTTFGGGKAINTALPKPLQDFITRDNALFHLELTSDPSQPPAYHEFEEGGENSSLESNIAVAGTRATAATTIGRRQRSASIDSTRADMGDDETPDLTATAPDSPRVLDDGDVDMFGSGSGGGGGGVGGIGGYRGHSGQENPGFGLGPDLGGGGGHFASSGGSSRSQGVDDDVPVHEIRLEDLDEGSGGPGGQEEK